MIWYILITIASLAAAYMVETSCRSYQGSAAARSVDTRGRALGRTGMLVLFLILFIPAALRQACGNDYMRYVEFFHLAYVDAYVPTEPGFNAFVKLIYHLCGYENYLLVFALFAFLTIALFLTAIYQQSQNFLFSFFLFMMSGYYFRSYSTVRYYFALAAAMFAIRLLLEREYILFVLVIAIAATFHKSVLCVLVLYPLARHRWRAWQVAGLVLAGAAVQIFRGQVMNLVVRLYPSYENTDILAQGGRLSPANILRCLLTLALCWICLSAAGEEDAAGGHHIVRFKNIREGARTMSPVLRFYYNTAWMSLFIYIFAWFIPEISRIAYYLTVVQIYLIPAMLSRIPETRKPLRRTLTFLTLAAATLMFATFLVKSYDIDIRLLPYKTFLFHDLPATPSRSIE